MSDINSKEKDTQAKENDLVALTKIKKVKIKAIEATEPIEVILYPFAFKHFNGAIAIINKYYGSYRKADSEYKKQKQYILDTVRDQQERLEKLDFLKNNFDEIGIIIEDILASQKSTLHDDISNFITYCLKGKEINFDDYDWGEVLVLLGAALELNLDFFTQTMKRIPLFQEVEKDKNNQKMRKVTATTGVTN